MNNYKNGKSGRFLMLISALLPVYAFSQQTESFIDVRDNTEYRSVEIGNQVWMAENLNYDLGEGCWFYDDDPHYAIDYGQLYTFQAAIKGCPQGWHLPDDDEWKELEIFLGMDSEEADSVLWRGKNIGDKLKSDTGWKLGGKGTNTSGFSALPGGYRYYANYFDYVEHYAIFWSSSSEYSDFAWCRMLYKENSDVYRGVYNKKSGLSVRCIRDH